MTAMARFAGGVAVITRDPETDHISSLVKCLLPSMHWALAVGFADGRWQGAGAEEHLREYIRIMEVILFDASQLTTEEGKATGH